MTKLIRKIKKVENVEIKPEEIGLSLETQQLKCNKIDCEEKDCGHYIFHNKVKACEVECGVHSEAKCI